MGDVPNTPSEPQPEVKIEIEKLADNRYPPPYQSVPQQQQYYQQPQQSPQWWSGQQTPSYQQQVGGQNVYYVGGPQPVDVSRGQQAYRVNYPGQQEEYQFYRNSEIFTQAFDSVAIRNRFVQRVYTILSLQLLVSFGFLLVVTYVKELRVALIQNFMIIAIPSIMVYFAIFLTLACCVEVRRNFPINFILLGILTLALTLLISLLVAVSDPIVVLAAIGTTAGVCFLISIFACQTQWDVTGCGMCLCIAMVVLLVYGLILMIMTLMGVYIRILHIIYSALATLLFCFYLMYDTQMIVGGRRIELSPEEYIFGALSLYVDIMYIFMHILVLYQHCLGGRG